MSLDTSGSSRFGFVRSYPADLGAVTGITVLCFAVGWTQPTESVARVLMAMVFVLFLPGYAAVSVLFPGRAGARRTAGSTRFTRLAKGIDTVERFGLSFALSLVVSAVVAIVLPFTEWGLTANSILATLTGTTIVLSQLAVIRRTLVPPEERYLIRPSAVVSSFKRPEETSISLSTVVLGFTVLAASGMLIFALASPLAAGGFSEMGLYTDDDDELVLGNIPDEVEPGESIPVTVSVDNQEGEETNYSILVQEQVLDDTTVIDRTNHDTIDLRLEDDESELTDYEVTPAAEDGETVRIVFLLYKDQTPVQPTTENADEYTYFWVTVEPDTQNTDNSDVDDGENFGDDEEFEDAETENDDADNVDDPDDDDGVPDPDDEDNVPDPADDDGVDDPPDDDGENEDTDVATDLENFFDWLLGSDDTDEDS